MICKHGELCGGTGFLRDKAGDRFCTCRQLQLQRTRLYAAGLADQTPKRDTYAALFAKYGCPSAAGVDAATLETFATVFALGEDRNKIVVWWPHLCPGETTMRPVRALAENMARVAAFSFDVVQLSARDLIDAAFDRLGRAEIARRAEDQQTAVLLSVGADAPHSYAGPLLFDLLRKRTGFPRAAAPTIVVVENLWSRLMTIYGELFVKALAQYRPVCTCVRP